MMNANNTNEMQEARYLIEQQQKELAAKDKELAHLKAEIT